MERVLAILGLGIITGVVSYATGKIVDAAVNTTAAGKSADETAPTEPTTTP